ncbi:MAG: NAD(P)H-binding protein [Acidobacteria bacterium]|nr:NAD(P)H-binding protein [Acidobacteriota bacterium]
MTRIAVLGGTGYTGGNIVREAAARGHHVTAYSRTAPAQPVEGVHSIQASFLEEGAVAAAVAGQDVVVEALAPRGELAGQLEGIVGDLARLAAEQGARLVVVGGWSGLRPAEGAPRFVEAGDTPPQFKAEAEEMVRALEWLERSAPEELDWLFVSPAQAYGSHNPGEALGRYRIGGSVALVDEAGRSAVSGADFALAVVDEIDRHEHRGHINVAS